MNAPLRTPSIAGTKMDRYFHVCALVRGKEEEYRVLGPFFREAIDWGEKALHILDPEDKDEDRERLRSFGIDVRAAEQRGQFDMMSWNEAYRHGDRFDVDRMLKLLEDSIEAGRESGYPRTRISGQVGRALHHQPGAEQLIEYEARVNDVLVRSRYPAVCVYDVEIMTGSMLMDILRTHPLTVVGGVVQENPLFTPPERFLHELRLRRPA